MPAKKFRSELEIKLKIVIKFILPSQSVSSMFKITAATATLASFATAQSNDMNRYNFAECNLIHNPSNPMGWEAGGQILMAQKPDGGPLWVRAQVSGLPSPGYSFGFAINEKGFNGLDCRSAGNHWNPDVNIHGVPNEPDSHIGDMPMIRSNGYYEGDLFARLGKPMLSGPYSIVNKAITIYEAYDDMGTGTG